MSWDGISRKVAFPKKGSCGYLQEAQLGGEGTTDALALSRHRAFKKQREG